LIRALFCLLLALAAPAFAQPADTILTGGRVLRFDAPPAEAIAIRGQEIAALGTTAEIATLAGPATRIIPLAGRTVIPGLIDSHIHAIRAGAAWGQEVSWIGAASIKDALARLSARAATTPQDAWLVVAGGWTPDQFAEARLPRTEEIAAAAPGRRVYIQLFYSRLFLSGEAAAALAIPAGGGLAAVASPRASRIPAHCTAASRAVRSSVVTMCCMLVRASFVALDGRRGALCVRVCGPHAIPRRPTCVITWPPGAVWSCRWGRALARARVPPQLPLPSSSPHHVPVPPTVPPPLPRVTPCGCGSRSHRRPPPPSRRRRPCTRTGSTSPSA
jgi:hypothetical protein